MRTRTKFLILTVGLLFVLTLGLGFFFATSLQNLGIKGNTYYSNEEIRKLLIKNRLDENALFLYGKLKYGKKIKAPFINEVDVDLIGFNQINIRIFEKDIVGAFPFMGEYVCFDKDGVMVGSITQKRDDVPVIEGIHYNKVVFNEEVDTDKPELFNLILNLTQLIKKYEISVESINFESDLSVKLLCQNVKVFLGKRNHFDEQISNLPEILAKSKGMKGVLRMEDYSALNRRVVFEGEDG